MRHLLSPLPTRTGIFHQQVNDNTSGSKVQRYCQTLIQQLHQGKVTFLQFLITALAFQDAGQLYDSIAHHLSGLFFRKLPL